jgi:uncharacterized membrane protein YkvA (DUF1232 family)
LRHRRHVVIRLIVTILLLAWLTIDTQATPTIVGLVIGAVAGYWLAPGDPPDGNPPTNGPPARGGRSLR